MWHETIINELVDQGADLFVISPGSRSTPLTLAVARHPGASHVMAYDERGAGYYAVGYARATGRPAVLICTSGTAAANYLPAVTEASNDALPLIAITADRPPELHGIGANQTIDQQDLYGGFVRRFINLPPEAPGDTDATAREAVTRALEACRRPVAGPVHINCMFREPFDLSPGASGVRPDRKAHAANVVPPVASEDVAALVQRASEARRPMLLVGDLISPTDREAVRSLATTLGWPVWVDIRSGLRDLAPMVESTCALDRLLTTPGRSPDLSPDFFLHVGGSFISKRMRLYLKDTFAGLYCKVPGDGRALDPSGRCAMTVPGTMADVCDALAPHAADLSRPGLVLAAPGARARLVAALQAESGDDRPLSEPSIGYLLSTQLAAAGGLFLGNSMPVRFCDQFAIEPGLPVAIAANRGVSGIDGTLASAIGFSAGLARPVVCVLGDLTFIHDLSSLSLLAGSRFSLVIIVINNRGGGIFHHLPIAGQVDVFDAYFVAPHDYEFEPMAQQFGLAYSRAGSHGAFVTQLREALARGGHTLLEVPVDQAANMAAYARMELARDGGA